MRRRSGAALVELWNGTRGRLLELFACFCWSKIRVALVVSQTTQEYQCETLFSFSKRRLRVLHVLLLEGANLVPVLQRDRCGVSNQTTVRLSLSKWKCATKILRKIQKDSEAEQQDRIFLEHARAMTFTLVMLP